MKLMTIIFFVLTLTSCFSRKTSEFVQKNRPLVVGIESKEKKTGLLSAVAILKKEQREAIYFSASLEKEALKILTKNPAFDELTLFSVLSYSLETLYGVKKTAPSHLDCSRFRFEAEPNNKRIIRIYKICQKPNNLIAEIQLGLDSSQMNILFFSKEWVSILGLSATLSGKNIFCHLKIENKKLENLNCEDWIRTLNVTNTSAEELRLKTFLFERKSPRQFILKGGFFKDLIEHKKIEVYVPLEGKIKRLEKEIEVIDQYAEQISKEETRTGRMQINSTSQITSAEIQGGFHENEKENQQKKAEQSKNPQKDYKKAKEENFNEENSQENQPQEANPYESRQNLENGGIPPEGR